MKFFGCFVGFSIIASILGDSCDHLGVLLYEDLGCTPEYGESKSCPIKYTCAGLEQPKLEDDKCYFRGKTYANKEKIEDSLSIPSCDIGCLCSTTRFVCAVLDCPEWIGGGQIKPGCYRTYSLDGCCSTGTKCPPFGDLQKCIVGGIEYKEGERFYPENTCQRCICQQGFKGKYEEPFCKRQTCGVQLRRSSGENLKNSCAPLYGKKSEKTLCCPSGWICPDGTENITGDAKKDDVCKFGNKTLNVGQRFEKKNIETSYGEKIEKVTCECVLPPLLACNRV